VDFILNLFELFYVQVLSGSGVYDGSEIHEASSVLVHLTREGAVPQCYAPDVLQMHVINHSKVLQYILRQCVLLP
jgi:enhancing lycopene biosynthesis protein 2